MDRTEQNGFFAPETSDHEMISTLDSAAPPLRFWIEGSTEGTGDDLNIVIQDCRPATDGALFHFAVPPQVGSCSSRLKQILAYHLRDELVEFVEWLYAGPEPDDGPNGDFARLLKTLPSPDDKGPASHGQAQTRQAQAGHLHLLPVDAHSSGS